MWQLRLLVPHLLEDPHHISPDDLFYFLVRVPGFDEVTKDVVGTLCWVLQPPHIGDLRRFFASLLGQRTPELLRRDRMNSRMIAIHRIRPKGDMIDSHQVDTVFQM